MPRILGRHELFPRLNQKSWLGSGCSFGSTDSATTATSTLRKSTTSVNLSVPHSEDRQNRSSSSSAGKHRLQGLTYRIDNSDEAREGGDDAWGYYVDFVEGERATDMDTTIPSNHNNNNNMDEEILCLETSMMKWALKRSSR